MKLDFCCVCGTKEDLHQHHIVPVVLSGVKRTTDDSDNTITVCTYHHDIIHGVIKTRTANHITLIKTGIEKAKEKGIKIGRPTKLTPDKMMLVKKLKLDGESIRDISKASNLGIGTVYKILNILEERKHGDSVNISEICQEPVREEEPATFLDLY